MIEKELKVDLEVRPRICGYTNGVEVAIYVADYDSVIEINLETLFFSDDEDDFSLFGDDKESLPKVLDNIGKLRDMADRLEKRAKNYLC